MLSQKTDGSRIFASLFLSPNKWENTDFGIENKEIGIKLYCDKGPLFLCAYDSTTRYKMNILVKLKIWKLYKRWLKEYGLNYNQREA